MVAGACGCAEAWPGTGAGAPVSSGQGKELWITPTEVTEDPGVNQSGLARRMHSCPSPIREWAVTGHMGENVSKDFEWGELQMRISPSL
jgi:hypothetical protein